MAEPPPIEHRELRSAIEYAVAMGDEIAKRRASISVPREIRAAAGKARIPTGSLGRLRRAIEADDAFRTAIAAGALPELVDPIGVLWLQRPAGWQARAEQLVIERAAEAADAELRTTLRREQKRRHAAEQVAVRLRADLSERESMIGSLRDDVDALRADVVKADDEIAALRAELVDVRLEARHARDRETAARTKLEAARSASRRWGSATRRSERRAGWARIVTGRALVRPSRVSIRPRCQRLPVRFGSWPSASIRCCRMTVPAPAPRPEARSPLRLPGGVIASSAAAAEFLLRSDAVVLVDGYNVAKLAWPNRSLEAQRNQLLDALENAARRFGSDITVVFDGAAVDRGARHQAAARPGRLLA